MESRVFRTRAVVVSGLVDLAVGVALAIAGIAISAGQRTSEPLPLGLTVLLVGVVVGAIGASHVTARLEIRPDRIVWWWEFSRYERRLGDLTAAVLVEPGSVNSGGAFGGFLAGGLVAVAFWWCLGVARSVSSASPTLGSRALLVLPRYGEPVRIAPIGTFAADPGASTAFAAQQAIESAIAAVDRPADTSDARAVPAD